MIFGLIQTPIETKGPAGNSAGFHLLCTSLFTDITITIIINTERSMMVGKRTALASFFYGQLLDDCLVSTVFFEVIVKNINIAKAPHVAKINLDSARGIPISGEKLYIGLYPQHDLRFAGILSHTFFG